ncbi:hypothetical protein, partial [Sinomonas sp.]|uniref:hypothetical protein n=1 Tax=Sinomonas sp. TaxID=1914986 RepID=UPI003F81988C
RYSSLYLVFPAHADRASGAAAGLSAAVHRLRSVIAIVWLEARFMTPTRRRTGSPVDPWFADGCR